MNKLKAKVFYYPERGGLGLSVFSEDGNKRMSLNGQTLEWEEYCLGQLTTAIILDEFEDHRSPRELGNLAGENEALKNENKFLRDQIAKLLERV